MSETASIDEPVKQCCVYILGAGFSCAAGLPLANELWAEVRKRATRLEGRAEKFTRNLNDYIEFKNRCDGENLTPDSVNFEEFLGYLDIEFHLGLLGKDTWSVDGNETQVIVKTLIGKILLERSPQKVPELYLEFARRVKPGDTILSFNYDLLVEKSLDEIRKSYRLFPDRYKKILPSGAALGDSEKDLSEVLVLKLHGSIDWFDKASYLRMEKIFQEHKTKGSPSDLIFNPQSGIKIAPLLDGPRFDDDPLKNVHRVVNLESLYAKEILFRSTPILVPPSKTKVLWFNRFRDFWWGMDSLGALNGGLAIVGFSLAAHDDYARQIIYSTVRNYQHVEWGKEFLGRRKNPVLIVDRADNADAQEKFKKRYGFVDWQKAELSFEGFNEDIVRRLPE